MPRLFPLVRHARTVSPDTDHALVARYAQLADQTAFAEIVRRHGPMVLGACRRVTRDPHLAEDAFQATFLVLARRAGSLHNPAALASWLFGVARRVGLAARRRHRPAEQGPPFPPTGEARPDWDDLLRVLDDELARLPERYRSPLLACYLEGLTRDEAAARLGWSVSTLGRRVAAGRELLRTRMTARGATLAGGLAAGLLAPNAAVAVPDGLARRVADLAAGGPVPPAVRGLAAVAATPAGKWALAAVLAVVTCGLALGTAARPGAGPDAPAGAQPPATDPPAGLRADGPDDPLPPGAVARMGSLRLRHSGGVDTLAFGLDGTVLVSAHQPAAHIWDVRTGRLLHTLGRRYDDEATETVVNAVGMSADGRTLTVQANRMVDRRSSVNRSFTWALAGGGRELRDFAVRQDPARQTAFRGPQVFAPDGSAMAEVDDQDDAVWVWDRDGNPVARLDGAVGAVGVSKGGRRPHAPVAFAPNGKTLYTLLPDHTVKVWSVVEKRVVRSFGAGKSKPLAVAVSADGKRLATFAATTPKDGPESMGVPEAIRVWDPAAGVLVREFAWGAADDTYATGLLGFDGGRVWAAAALRFGIRFRLWDMATGKEERNWFAPTPDRQAHAVALAPGAGRLAAAFGGGVIQMYDAETGKDVTPGGGHRGEVTDLRFTPDGSQLVTVAEDRTLRTWEVASGKELAVRDGLSPFARLSTDGATLFDGRQQARSPKEIVCPKEIVATDRLTGRVVWEFRDTSELYAVPIGKTVWVNRLGSKDVALLDAPTGRVVRELPMPGHPVGFGEASRLVICADAKEVTGWDADTGRKRFGWDAKAAGLLRAGTFRAGNGEQEYADGIDTAAVSPDGRFVGLVVSRHLLIEDDQSSLFVCEAATGRVVWRVKSDHHFGRSVEFSPDGRRVAAAGWKARLFDAATGEEKAVLDGHRSFVDLVTFSRDGRRLASGASDGTAVVWDVAGR